MARRTFLRWLFACLLFVTSGAYAQTAPPGSRLSPCVARALPGDREPAMLDAPDRYRCGVAQRAYGPGDYWLIARASPTAPGVDGTRELRFASLWQRRTVVLARYADGWTVRVPLGGVALARHLRPGAIVQVDLPSRAAPHATLLWRVDGAANLRGIVNDASLLDEREAFAADLVMTAIYAGFAALCVTLLIYNLALLTAMRQRFQIAYCVMVTALLGYAVSSSGALAWLVPGIANNDRLRVNYVMLALSAAAALMFARHYFER